jgi:hypothetical protein
VLPADHLGSRERNAKGLTSFSNENRRATRLRNATNKHVQRRYFDPSTKARPRPDNNFYNVSRQIVGYFRARKCSPLTSPHRREISTISVENYAFSILKPSSYAAFGAMPID